MRHWLFGLLYLIPIAAFAHDHQHAQYNEWMKQLKNGHGVMCCDGSDAYSVLDPDWEMAEGHFKVRQSTKHKWFVVDEMYLVTENNKMGIAKVWPTIDASGLWTSVRCFMPGSAT